MVVEVHFITQSKPIVYYEVVNAYEKGSFYCIYDSKEQVYKHPIIHIFRIVEDYK